MINFNFSLPTEIIFGKDVENNIGEKIKSLGYSKVLLHYGGGSIKKSGLYDRVINSLNKENIEFVELGGAQPNPRLTLVKQGIELARKNKVDFILAVGGGSAIDSAKAIGLGLAHPDINVWDFYIGKAKISNMTPLGVILTIPAAGSESSTSSVITNEEGWIKRGTGSELLKPLFAFMNPELTYSLPDYQTACGVADMLAHVLERYFTNTKDVELVDRLCEATMKTIINNAFIALKNNTDFASRSELMWAGTIAHNGLLSVGRVSDWASHGLEHELSALYDIAHGAGLAIIFPNWMRYVYKQDIARFAKFANQVFNVEINPFNLEQTAIKGIDALEAFFKSIGLPTTFKEANLPTDDLELMAKKAVSKPLGQFVKLNEQDALAIYKLASK